MSRSSGKPTWMLKLVPVVLYLGVSPGCLYFVKQRGPRAAAVGLGWREEGRLQKDALLAGRWGKPRTSVGLNWVPEGPNGLRRGSQILPLATAVPKLPLHTFTRAPWTVAVQGVVWLLGGLLGELCTGSSGDRGYQHRFDPLSSRLSGDSPCYSTSNLVLTLSLKPAFNTSRWHLKGGRMG